MSTGDSPLVPERLALPSVRNYTFAAESGQVKSGTPSVHPLGGIELRSLRRLLREQPESRYVFLAERPRPASSHDRRERRPVLLSVDEIETEFLQAN